MPCEAIQVTGPTPIRRGYSFRKLVAADIEVVPGRQLNRSDEMCGGVGRGDGRGNHPATVDQRQSDGQSQHSPVAFHAPLVRYCPSISRQAYFTSTAFSTRPFVDS